MKKLISILLLSLSTTVFAQWNYNQKPPLGMQIDALRSPDGLVAFWMMNENGGDLVKNLILNPALDGTIVNSMPWVPGKYGPALQGDGSEVTEQHILVPDSDLISFGDGTTDKPFSIVVWFNLQKTSGGDLQIMKGNDVSDGTLEWDMYTYDATLRFRMFDSTSGVYIRRISDDSFTTGWHQFAGTSDGSGSSDGIKLYVDGLLKPSTASNQGTYTAMHSTAIGLYFGGAFVANEAVDAFSTGAFSSVMIFDRVITASEVSQLYIHQFYFINNPPLSLWGSLQGGGTTSIYHIRNQ